MNPQSIIVKRKGKVGIITLNRPEKRNSLSAQLVDETLEALRELDSDADIMAIIIRGAGSSFCAGHDFSEIQGKPLLELRRVFRKSLYLVETIGAMGKPVIAAVHGYATAMGCALAAGCDLVIAAEDALFQLPGAAFGAACISPAAVVCRSIGVKKCMELLLTGDPISAAEAEKAGMVNRVVPSGELDEAAEKLAQRLANNAPLALKLGKEALYTMLGMAPSQAYRYAAEMISINFATEDGREGVASFTEKRKRKAWQGR